MPDDILLERTMAHGPTVRVRRTSDAGVTPVVAVIEVDRRAGTPRAGGPLPPLVQCEAPSETAALAQLEPQASDDRAIVQLLHAKGLH